MKLFKILSVNDQGDLEVLVLARSFLDAQELFTKHHTTPIKGIFIIECLIPTELIESDQD